MPEKFDYYDLLGTLVPGMLLTAWIPICFPALLQTSAPKYPDAFAAIVLVGLSVFIGQIIQALASILIEPLLYRIWGGRPSDKVFSDGLPNFPVENSARIRGKLAADLGESASDSSLFFRAMQISESATPSRVPRFNSLYAYHRSLVVMALAGLLVFLASTRWGFAAEWSTKSVLLAAAGCATLLLIVVHRTKQRAHYYVREVLLTAERVIDSRTAPTSNQPSGTPVANGG